MRSMRVERYSGGFWGRRRPHVSPVIWALFWINTLIFVGGVFTGAKIKLATLYLFGLKTPAVNRPEFEGDSIFRVLETITYAFIHGDWAHLLSNMAFMMLFGQLIALRFGVTRGRSFGQRLWGSVVFLLFYLSAACFCAIVFLLMNMEAPRTLIGASGAVAALMGGAICVALRKFQPFGLFHGKAMGILDPKVLIMTGAYIGVNLWQGFQQWQYGSSIEAGLISWETHIAGFLYGVVMLPYFDGLIARR